MCSLASLLQRQKRFLESEQLLTIAMSLRNDRNTMLWESDSDIIAFNEQEMFLEVLLLVHGLNASGSYTRSRDLLEEAKNRFSKILEIEGRLFLNYHYEVARSKRLAGELDDSEEILKDLLRRHGSSMYPHRKMGIMRELAEVLDERDRLEEATIWFEREFAVLLDNVGLENPLMKSSCRRVGLCYAEMGRYDEAMLHFERMLEKVASEDSNSINNRHEYVQEINRWMVEVDGMRAAALGTAYVESEDTTTDDTATEDSSKEGSTTLEYPSDVGLTSQPLLRSLV
jgi:tetratricopeptide (TPR) repeat protein